jgi:hypothetical protein
MILHLALFSLLATDPTTGSESAPLRVEEQVISAQSGPMREGSVAVQVRPLSWEGSAIVYAGGREINIRVRTRISRTGDVISESWLADQGENAVRRMIIDASGGWMERDGKREPMPEAMLRHERQQFGLYNQLQPAIVFARMIGSGETTIGGDVSTSFRIKEGVPIEARNQVSSPEPGGKPIDQEILLSDYKTEDGFSWPRRIEIHHDGKPYFSLSIDKFEAGAVP